MRAPKKSKKNPPNKESVVYHLEKEKSHESQQEEGSQKLGQGKQEYPMLQLETHSAWIQEELILWAWAFLEGRYQMQGLDSYGHRVFWATHTHRRNKHNLTSLM